MRMSLSTWAALAVSAVSPGAAVPPVVLLLPWHTLEQVAWLSPTTPFLSLQTHTWALPCHLLCPGAALDTH